MRQPVEIERKFLIAMPDPAWLAGQKGVRFEEITQTYLKAPDGEEARVRRRGAQGAWTYVKTVKRALCGITREEIETEITREEYETLLGERDPFRRTIEKTRCSFPYAGHVLEIDVYPFFAECAVLEAELKSEDEALLLPEEIAVIREVTLDHRFRNAALAACKDPAKLI